MLFEVVDLEGVWWFGNETRESEGGGREGKGNMYTMKVHNSYTLYKK